MNSRFVGWQDVGNYSHTCTTTFLAHAKRAIVNTNPQHTYPLINPISIIMPISFLSNYKAYKGVNTNGGFLGWGKGEHQFTSFPIETCYMPKPKETLVVIFGVK